MFSDTPPALTMKLLRVGVRVALSMVVWFPVEPSQLNPTPSTLIDPDHPLIYYH
jgi:hypothetical protein